MGTSTTTTALFADIDRMDAEAFASYLADDCVLRFGNAEEIVGRDAIQAAIDGFFRSIDGLSHELREVWEAGDATIVQVEVTYTRLDGGTVTLPAAIVQRRRGGDLIDEYRIFVDQTPLYA
jgi:ketosteroid isomerase-like protein